MTASHCHLIIENTMNKCCTPPKSKDTPKPSGTDASCCAPDKESLDWLLWGSASVLVTAYLITLFFSKTLSTTWLNIFGQSVFELVNTMWWGMLLAIIFVGILSKIPQSFIVATLGQGGSWRGLLRATGAGVLLDLCSHGILMVGMQLYQRGASLGQVMAFLIASPWNSLSLTVIMISLIGLSWTLLFIALSVVVALISGRIFDLLVRSNRLPTNPNAFQPHEGFRFWREAKIQLKSVTFSFELLRRILIDGLRDSRMVMRWLLFGIVLASIIRTIMDVDAFQTWFGPTMLGLGLTLVAATIIEVCSEGSTPIAADLLTRAKAPGNSFTFLMAGVATDYTEVMSIKDTTRSWKIALFLPLVTLPQILIMGWILNQTAAG